MRSSLLSTLPALGLATAILVPFLNKAFTIDDTLFMRQAQQALLDPLHPTAFTIVWEDTPRRLSAIMPSGPVMAYLLLPAAAAGGLEWLGHLVQWLMLALGLWGTVRLARRLGFAPPAAAAAALLVVSSPAVLGMAATCMPDVPAMALGVLGIERYLAFLAERRWRDGLLAALLLALATLARSHLGLLGGVALLFALGDRLFEPRRWWRLSWRSLWPLGVNLLLVAVVVHATRDQQQGSGVVSSIRFFTTLLSSPKNFLAFLAHWSLAMLLGVPWAVAHWPRLSQRLLWGVTGVAAVLLVLFHQPSSLLAAPFIGLSTACLFDIARQALRERDQLGAILFVWLLLAFPVTLYVHFPSKYLVPSAPAAALLLVRALYRRADGGEAWAPLLPRPRRLLLGSCAAGLLLGLLIVHTDADFAALGRRAAAELVAPRVAAGQRVWFAGHWGYQWYAERSGARPLTITPPLPQPGDIVVGSLRAEGHYIKSLPNRRSIGQLEESRLGGRVMAREVGAGFFSNGAGLYPWMLSTQPLDRYDVYLVTPRSGGE